jgi:capsular polysaccharide biosynthesis protein
LDQHDLTLRVLSKNLEASESNGGRLIRLSAELSQQNESLKTYNDQIGQRMQESDEWNAELQDENIGLKAEVKVMKVNGLRNTVIAGAGGMALGFFIPFIIKLLRKFKVIPV